MESTDVNESKESKKKQEKDRKKGEKKMDQFIKSIANCTPDEKVDALCKKNSDSLDQIRNLKTTAQLLQRKIIVLEKEKEQLQNEQSKGVLARSRLETLCRELQRQNKSIKDESMQKIREEEEKRKEVSTRFQTALNEVSVMMQQNTDKNIKLRDDNIEISNKFQKLCDQFKQREEEVIRLTKQMDLEKQLAEATVKRIECQLNAERGIWSKEKEHYASQLKFHEEEKLKFESNIKNLEEHLSLYSNKYSDFESTIAKSNEVFDNYKVELNRMSKQIQKLEQENNIWKEKWIQSQHAFTNVTLEHRTCEQHMQERDKKLKQLADLCRSIQEERSAYLKQLKENGLTPVVVIVEKPSVEPEKPKSNPHHKMTKKEKQLSLLKKEMQAIEKQLANTLKVSSTENECVNTSQSEKHDSAETSATVIDNEKQKNATDNTPLEESQNEKAEIDTCPADTPPKKPQNEKAENDICSADTPPKQAQNEKAENDTCPTDTPPKESQNEKAVNDTYPADTPKEPQNTKAEIDTYPADTPPKKSQNEKAVNGTCPADTPPKEPQNKKAVNDTCPADTLPKESQNEKAGNDTCPAETLTENLGNIENNDNKGTCKNPNEVIKDEIEDQGSISAAESIVPSCISNETEEISSVQLNAPDEDKVDIEVESDDVNKNKHKTKTPKSKKNKK